MVAGNVNEGDSGAVKSTLTNAIKIATEEINATDLETFLDNFGSELIHAIVRSVANNMVDGSAAISWRAVLTNVLDAPIAKLPLGNDINFR